MAVVTGAVVTGAVVTGAVGTGAVGTGAVGTGAIVTGKETKTRKDIRKDDGPNKQPEKCHQKSHHRKDIDKPIQDLDQIEDLKSLAQFWQKAEEADRKKIIDLFVQNGYSTNLDDIQPEMPNPHQLFNFVAHAFKIASEMGVGSIIIAPGRSPIWHAKVLQQLKVPCYSFAFSCSPYLKEIPSKDEIIGFRTYLTNLGMTPTILDQAEKICFVDYIETGNSIQSLLMFFAQWKYDLNQEVVSDPKDWIQIFKTNPETACYTAYRKKITRLYSICLYQREMNPDIASIPLTRLSLNSSLAGYLYNNRFSSTLPAFPSSRWALPADLLQSVLNNSPMDAQYTEYNLVCIVGLIKNVVLLADHIYGMGTGVQVLDYHEDFMPLPTNDDGFIPMAESQFMNSFLPKLIHRLLAGYPKYIQEKDKMGVNTENQAAEPEKYENIADFLVGIYEGVPLDLKKPYENKLFIEFAEKNLSQHPNYQTILQDLTLISDDLAKPLKTIAKPQKSFLALFNLKNANRAKVGLVVSGIALAAFVGVKVLGKSKPK